MTSKHKDYNEPSCNVLVKWEDVYETYEPLDIIIKDDPITLAQYAEDNGLLDRPGWKGLTRFVKDKKIPRNVKEDLAFDEANGNDLWKEAMDVELACLHEYDTFEDMGPQVYNCLVTRRYVPTLYLL
jgi:hypothetical protein